MNAVLKAPRSPMTENDEAEEGSGCKRIREADRMGYAGERDDEGGRVLDSGR